MTKLYRFELLSDVYVDACLRDAEGRLLFLSCYGRDTSIQQMLASFTLPATSGGLESFHLLDANKRRHAVNVGDTDRLEKLTGRLPRDNLFGNLVHTWVFDQSLQQIDFANRIAWLMDRQSSLQHASGIDRRIWEIYKQLSPVPLLDHWQSSLLEATRAESITAFDQRSLYEPLGDIVAYRIQLQESFLDTVSDRVKSQALTLHDQPAKRLAA